MSTNAPDPAQTGPTVVPPTKVSSANLGAMARQFLDRNVRQYIEQNQLSTGNHSPQSSSSTSQPCLFANPNLNTTSDLDDQLNCELLQLRHHFTMLTSRTSQCTSATPTIAAAGPTPLPESESLQLRCTPTANVYPNEMNITPVSTSSNTIYAQVKRSPKNGASPRSKFIEFLNTIEPYSKRSHLGIETQPTSERTTRSAGSHDPLSGHNPVIYYSLNAAVEQQLVCIDSNRKCFSLVSESGTDSKTPKLFAYDHLFSGSLPDKLRALPICLLGETINCLVQNYIASAVIVSIDSADQNPENSGQINEFQELGHRGLMLHSIAWIFDAIAHRSRASVKISVSAVTNEYIYDLLGSEAKSGGKVETKSEETEYSCTSAKQAAAYLEQALEVRKKFKEQQEAEFGEHLLAVTLHLYQYRIVRLANGKSKVIGNHSKLYIFEVIFENEPQQQQNLTEPELNDFKWPPLSVLLSSFFANNQPMNNSIICKSKITQTLATALLNDTYPPTSRRSKRNSLPSPPFGKVSLSILANLKHFSADPETNTNLLLNQCQLVASIERTQILNQPNYGSCLESSHRLKKLSTCSSSRDRGREACQCRKPTNRKLSCDLKYHADPCEASTANGSAITSSSEQSFDTVIFRGQLINTSSPSHRQLIEKLNSFQAKSDSSGGSKNSLPKNASEGELLPPYSENVKNSDSDGASSGELRSHHRCNSSSRSRRNSIDSNHTDSTNTKARLKWWSDRRRHRSSAQSAGSRKNSAADCQNYGSSSGGSVRRIRKKKLKNAIWTEELWVDGPNAVPAPPPVIAGNTNSPGKSSDTARTTSSELNEMHKKQQRIEQWIQSTFSPKGRNGTVGTFTTSQLPAYATVDQTLFWLNNQPQLESYLPYGDLVLDNRDTLSDCGDKKSDFYDNFHEMWNGGCKVVNSGTLTRDSKSGKNSKMGPGNYYPMVVSGKGEFIDTCETDCTSEPILVVTEPPKQLKLEQFLQQLSKISFPVNQLNSLGGKSGVSVPGIANSGLEPMLNLPSSSSSGFPGQSGTVDSSGCTVTTSGIVTSSSGSTHYHQSSMTAKQQETVLNKMKRNTTSTTTSGHGTISEGECSSILGALPLSSGIGSKSAKTNGNTAGNNSATSNSVSTPGSGTSGLASGTGVGVIQRQPASSGYESTIQDEDEFLEEDHLGLEYPNESGTEITVDLGGGNCFGYSKRKKKKRIWTNQLNEYAQNFGSSSCGPEVIIGQPSTACLDVDGVTTLIIDPESGEQEYLEQPTTDGDVCSFFCCSIRKTP